MSLALLGNDYNTFSDGRDGFNHVNFIHNGRLDGRLRFDLQGSGGDNWVSANIQLASGSVGFVGQNGVSHSASVRGGGGRNDDLDLIVRWQGSFATDHLHRADD